MFEYVHLHDFCESQCNRRGQWTLCDLWSRCGEYHGDGKWPRAMELARRVIRQSQLAEHDLHSNSSSGRYYRYAHVDHKRS